MVNESPTGNVEERSPAVQSAHQRHNPSANVHLLESQYHLGRTAPEIEENLNQVREDAIYIEDFALELSRQRKRPVLILCNASSGSYFYPTIINSLEQLTEEAERNEFAKDVRHNPHWNKADGKRRRRFWNKADGKRRAMFETAQNWIDEGRLPSFIYPLKEIKISSCAVDPIKATPYGLDSIIKSGCDMIFADYSSREFPGSFASHDASQWGDDPGFKEFLQKKSRRYQVYLASRLSKKSEHLPETCLKKAIETNKPVVICLNPLLREHEEVYHFIDDNHKLLGRFGHQMTEYRDKKFRPLPVQTTTGEMELGDFVRQYLCARK